MQIDLDAMLMDPQMRCSFDYGTVTAWMRDQDSGAGPAAQDVKARTASLKERVAARVGEYRRSRYAVRM